MKKYLVIIGENYETKPYSYFFLFGHLFIYTLHQYFYFQLKSVKPCKLAVGECSDWLRYINNQIYLIPPKMTS